MKKAVFLGLLLLVSCGKSEQAVTTTAAAPAPAAAGGNLENGKQLMVQYGCNGCHVIPGMGGGNLGPSLERYGSNGTIVQKFPNNMATLTQWIMSPQSMDPNTTMPPSGMSEPDARDAAAFLLSFK